MKKEKRNYVRINSVNLINYICFDENMKEESQGMGRTLNVSEAGLLLETNKSFEINKKVSLNIGLEEELISINGIVIFTNSDSSGFSNSGIQFKSSKEEELKPLKEYIKAFLAQN